MTHTEWVIRTSFIVSTMDKSAPILGFPSAECTISLQFFKRIVFIFWASLDIWIRSIGSFFGFPRPFWTLVGFYDIKIQPMSMASYYGSFNIIVYILQLIWHRLKSYGWWFMTWFQDIWMADEPSHLNYVSHRLWVKSLTLLFVMKTG